MVKQISNVDMIFIDTIVNTYVYDQAENHDTLGYVNDLQSISKCDLISRIVKKLMDCTPFVYLICGISHEFLLSHMHKFQTGPGAYPAS
jgi:hypothetical protein